MQSIDEIVKLSEVGYFYVSPTNEAPIVTIRNDGTIEVNPKYELDDAARAFWDAVRNMTPHRPTPSATSVCEECGLPMEWCSDKAMRRLTEAANERLRSDLDKVRRETWEEISTAPMDETHVLVASEGEVYEARYFSEEGWFWVALHPDDYNARPIYPTHWMPLPAPPARATAKGGQTDD